MTKIEWVKNQDGSQGRTWSPVTGCTKISPGCAHCYAERMARRLAGRCGYPEAPHHFNVTLHPDKLDVPFKRRKPTMYFVPSMGDLFHEDVPFGFIWEVWKIMRACPQHTFQILTKRSERMADDVLMFYCAGEKPLSNVWLGVSVENQSYLWRVEELLKCPAAVRFVSVEPLLGPIDLTDYLPRIIHDSYPSSTGPEFQDGLDWVIVGGESGPGARPMDPNWAKDIRDQCMTAGVPFFFKQHGAWLHESQMSDGKVLGVALRMEFGLPNAPSAIYEWPDGTKSFRVGKKAAGRLLDSREWNEMPR